MQNIDCTTLTNVMDLLLDAICVVDANGYFVSVSAACERIFGYTPAEMIGRQMIDMVHPEDRTRTLATVDEIMAGQLKPHFENRYVRKDGRIVHIMWSARWSEADQVRIAVARDVTERKRAESIQTALYAISEAVFAAEDLPALFQRIHQIIDNLLPARNFFVALYDNTSGELTFPYYIDQRKQAPVTRQLTAGTPTEVVIRSGQPLLLAPATHTPANAEAQHWLGVPLIAQKGTIGALVVKNYAGDEGYAEQDVELLQFVSTQIAVAIERKQMEVRLQHSARHDPLTNLPNRELFHDRLQNALAWARREHTRLSVLYIDLDMFKAVNDTFGHATGDLLLQEVARRLQHCARESDTVGRVGGDEFLVLLNSIQLPEHALVVAEKINAALVQPFELAGRRLHISPSIGIAIYPEHGDDHQQLIAYADQAMYAAKRSSGKRLHVTEQNPPIDSTP